MSTNYRINYTNVFGTILGTGFIVSVFGIKTVPPNHIAYTNLFGNVNTKKLKL
jgi:hypothetical protein